MLSGSKGREGDPTAGVTGATGVVGLGFVRGCDSRDQTFEYVAANGNKDEDFLMRARVQSFG